jgi:hypothetical protein
VPITITDHSYRPGLWEFITTTITATAGTAYWDPVDWSVRWNSQVISTSPVQTATFRVIVKNVTFTETKVFTNYAYMEVGDYPGSLPGSLPGTLPGSVPGSVPFSVPGDSRVVWDNFTITPLAVTFSLSPTSVVRNTPYAVEVYTLTITNNDAAMDTFAFTHAATDTSGLVGAGLQYNWGVVSSTNSIQVGAGLSATVVVTVQVPTFETTWVTHTLLFTATSQNNGAELASTLTTHTGGRWTGTQWVGCRFDFLDLGSIIAGDYRLVYGQVGTSNPLYDFYHFGSVIAGDYRLVYDQVGMSCEP